MTNSLSITLWNTEWTKPGTARASVVSSLLHSGDPEIICATEGFRDLLSPPGHIITSAEDYGYGTQGGRRKVLLWSKNPWSDVDAVGSPLMPAGRFVTGTTETNLGAINVIGVCIPWHDAHVRTGRKDRAPWQDHLAFLDGLEHYLNTRSSDIPTVLLGDFNQRIPRARQPKNVFNRLQYVLHSRSNIVTGGVLDGVNAQSIDHLATSSELKSEAVETFSNVAESGIRLSDHFGLRLRLHITTAPQSHANKEAKERA